VSGSPPQRLGPGLMVCGTSSEAGKSTLVSGLCRLLGRRGLRVAPFKAQNMSLNSAVTPQGAEIGRAQASQAEAAGVEPEAAMNPVLLKPTSERTSQVVVMGRPWAVLDAAAYQRAKAELWPVVLEALASLSSRYDVVVAEGAGSPAEINLMGHDIVNLAVAEAAGWKALLVGDIDRGGVFASLFGTHQLLPPSWQGLVGGFVVNKLRGDPSLLGDGPARLEALTGVPTLGVLPMLAGVALDSEDSLGLGAWPRLDTGASGTEEVLDIAVVRLPRISNFTDFEPLAAEPGCEVRLVSHPRSLGRPDLVILPGSKATVADLGWLRSVGLAQRIRSLVADPQARTTLLGICGGYQMLGRELSDQVECPDPEPVAGLGLLPTRTEFAPSKTTRRVSGQALGQPVWGYEIRHGQTEPASAWVVLETGPEGSMSHGGAVMGTSVHGIFDSDGFRHALLAQVAERAGKTWLGSRVRFAELRAARFDHLADALEEHLDLARIEQLIGMPTNSLKAPREGARR